MYKNIDSLVLPFLDQEFQAISRIPDGLVADYCRFALIASPRVITSPSFFAESSVTRNSILTSSDFYGTDHVKLSLRESNLEEFFKKKQPFYHPWKNEIPYQGYYAVAEELIRTLKLPMRQRTVQIGKAIAMLWLKNAKSEAPFSFFHMTNSFQDASIKKSVWQALAIVPNELKDEPFIWQNVCTILDRNEPRWRLPEFEKALRSFLLKCYFESLCEPGDAIVAFSDFQDIEVDDKSFSQPVVPLFPLRQFLTSAGVIDTLREMSVEEMLGIINSNVCHDFRYRYFEIIHSTYEGSDFVPNVDGLLGVSYPNAVKWCRVFSKWVGYICGEVGNDAKKRRKEWTVSALLDDAAARGFVEHLKRTGRSSLAKLNELQQDWAKESSSSANIIIHITNINNMNKTSYNGNNVGVMGPGAQGNTVNQSIIQDQRKINLPILAQELAKLGLAMKDAATEPEHSISIGQVAQAELEAKAGNITKAMEFLKSAGKWTLEQATKIGVDTATAVIKQALGLPPT